MAFVAIAFLATSASVIAVALAFALYALVRPTLGDAGASAAVAGAFAVILAVGGFIAMPRGRKRPGTGTPAGVAEDLMELVRDKPIASAGVALGAAIMAMRNPRVIGEIARAFVDGRARKPKR